MRKIDPLDLPPPEPASGDSSVDLQKIIRLLLDRGWLIVSCVVLAVIGAAVYVQRAPRIYEATTTVQVEQEDAKVIKAEQVVSEDMRGLDVLNTVAQKLCSDALLAQALDAHNLLPATNAVAAPGTPSRGAVLGAYAGNLKATLRRNTRLIDVTVRNTDPALAAGVANSLVEDYLQDDAQAQRSTTGDASAFLKEEAERQKKKLADAEQALQDYRQKTGSVSLQQSQDIVTPQLLDLNTRLTQSKAALVQAEGAYQDSEKMSTNVDELLAYPLVSADMEVMRLTGDVAKAQNEFVVVRKRYREKHPKYILAKESLDGLQAQLDSTILKVRARIQEGLRIAYDNARTSEKGLEEQLSQVTTNAMQLAHAGVQFDALNREVESDKAQFDAIISRLGETSVAAQITPERIRVIQPALVPEFPATPRIRLIFALALLGGLAVGLGACFVLDLMDTSFRTVDEVEGFLALPVLGTVPKLPTAKTLDKKLVAAQDSSSPEAEIYRTLRANLSMLGRENNRRTYLFTSSLPGEGKTFNSVNYALSLAQQGLRTLLIDLDLRRPMVEEFLTGKNSQLPGVTDYFLGHKKFAELCLATTISPNFNWIPAGTLAPNPSELIAQSDFQALLNEALAQYDRVVIDTAPLLPVSDTLLIADKVQTVVLVVRSGKTVREAVERAVRALVKAGAPVSGVILNFLPTRRSSGYYYSYRHGYGYGSYTQKKLPLKSQIDA